ncbi:MAG: DUF6164 family protein [Aquisalimonadaceae bacterium]
MAKQLMNLRNVPDDEADEVRALLAEHRIDFYETPPHQWGLSMGAIWLRDDARKEEAKRLLEAYQKQRYARVHAEHEAQKRAGTADTVASLFRRDPLRFLLYLALVGVILYFSIKPFLSMGT